MWHDFIVALCLVMVIEGIMPFVAPKQWRQAMFNAIRLDDKHLRLIGFFSMLSGVVMLYWVN